MHVLTAYFLSGMSDMCTCLPLTLEINNIDVMLSSRVRAAKCGVVVAGLVLCFAQEPEYLI